MKRKTGLPRNSLPSCLLVLLIVFGTNSAYATVMQSEFTVLIQTGPLVGNSYVGRFQYDDSNLTGIGFEYIYGSRGLFQFEFEWKGQVFTETSNDGFSAQAEFTGGEFVGIRYFRGWSECCNNFYILPSGVTRFLYETMDRPSNERILDGHGSVTYRWIPAPPSQWLFVLGFLGVFWTSRHEKKGDRKKGTEGIKHHHLPTSDSAIH